MNEAASRTAPASSAPTPSAGAGEHYPAHVDVRTLRAFRIFGQLRSSQILLVVLSALTLAASLYLWVLDQRSADIVASMATREARAVLDSLDLQSLPPDGVRRVQEAEVRVHSADWIAGEDPKDEAVYMQLTFLPQSVGANTHSLWPAETPTHFLYLQRLEGGRVATLTLPLASIAAPINRHLARSYVATGILAFIFIGGLVWLFRSARRDLARLQIADNATRAAALDELDPPHLSVKRRNLLPWLLAGTCVLFVVDWYFEIMPVSGALYVLGVILSLSSTRAWHTIAIAAWSLFLSFLALALNVPSGPLWPTLSAHALIVYFIVGAAAFGLAMQRRLRGESLALSKVNQAREESEQLRSTLARASAADARMRSALERLTLATKYAGISVWEWDLIADMVFASEGSDFGARLGSTTHLRGGEFLRIFVHPDDRDEFAKVFRSAIVNDQSDGQIRHRYRSTAPDGSILHIDLHARVYRDEQGKALRIIGVDRDVSREVEAALELERQSEQLRDVERRLERASLSNLEGHWEADLLTGQSWVSSSFCALMGFARGEFEALHIAPLELTHPDDQARQESAYLAHLQQGTPYDLQLRLRNARGEYRWFRVQGAAERDAQQRPVRMSGAIQDIHMQKLAEDALRDAQARFVRAVNGAQDGLFDYDLEHDKTWFSPRCKRMLGYNEDEFNIPFSELMDHVHAEDVPQLNHAFLEHVKRRAPYDIEHRLKKKNGDWLWVRSRAVAEFGRSGRAIRLSGSVQDISEARRARQELEKATSTAESANAAKSTFLATMSHEIRTPMNGIVGMTELLLDTNLDRAQREYAAIIRGSADSLLRVINDVLDFSKIEAGKLEIDVTDMDLRSVIEDVCALMALQAAAKNVELVLDIRPEVPEFVRGDAQRIRQCLLNLLSNAVKFTQAGEIVIEVCVLAQKGGNSLIQFQVRDTGIGMSAEQMEALFQPFMQADSSTTRRFGGTGLGLSIVKRLVELMNGRVGVDSKLGQGSTFWIVLPLLAVEATGKFARLNVNGLGRRVLVVDDNEANRNVLGAQLTRAGFTTELAADGAAALQALRTASDQQSPFDAALVDYQMPIMDGAMFGEIVNADSKLSTTRLVLLTSMDSAGDRSRFSGIGFAAYLPKPVRQRELIGCVQQVLASDAREWHLRSQPMLTRNMLSTAARGRQFSGRVLVAEDNDVNRKVAQKYLERLGCSVETVEDGAQCVAVLRDKRFDLVLMDMQMPVMDGISATRAIRANERGGKRTPIVALTANVMPGQLELCLDAGMDDFLGKPLDVERLSDVLDRFGFSGESVEASSVKSPARDSSTTPVDWSKIEAAADGDAAFVRELLSTFVESTTATLRELRAAAARNDRSGIIRGAHKIKGASGEMGARQLNELAKALEKSASELSEGQLENALDELDAAMRRVREYTRNREASN